MTKQGIAISVVFAGVFCGACEKNNGSPQGNGDADRDADVVISFSVDAAMSFDVSSATDRSISGETIPCQSRPTSGEACDPLPAGVFCRQGSCTGGCESECRCKEGTWSCAVICRDHFSPIPIDCGSPPLCRDVCQTATVLPDGGLVLTDADYTIGYQYGIQFTPPDQTTLWGEQKLRVAINSGPALDKTWLRDLATRLSVRTWPEMEDVPSTNTVEAGISSSDNGAISIAPISKLADRWYVLRLSAPPFWLAKPATHVAPDGSYVARFLTGSQPKVVSVTFAGGPNKHRLYMGLSESVTANQAPTGIVQIRNGGSPVACTDVGFAANKPMQSLSFDCPSLSVFPDEIIIGVGLVSTTGVALVPVTLAKSDLSLSSSCGESCQVGVVP